MHFFVIFAYFCYESASPSTFFALLHRVFPLRTALFALLLPPLRSAHFAILPFACPSAPLFRTPAARFPFLYYRIGFSLFRGRSRFFAFWRIRFIFVLFSAFFRLFAFFGG